MKKLSVAQKELLTDGIMNLIIIVVGITDMFCEPTLPLCIAYGLLLVIMCGTFILRKNENIAEKWDELAKENYAKACKQTLRISLIAGLIYGIIMDIILDTVILQAGHIMILVGCINLLVTIIFVYYEKRVA